MTSRWLSDQALTPWPHLQLGTPLPPCLCGRTPNLYRCVSLLAPLKQNPKGWEQGAVLELMLTAANCAFNKGGHGPSLV